MRPTIPSRWSSVIIHPRSVPATRFLARLVADDAASAIGPRRLRRLAPVLGTASAVRHALDNRRPDPAVDLVLDAVHANWDHLVDEATPGRLPDYPPARDAMSVLVLERDGATTVFVFASDPAPLVVAKLGGFEVEEQALIRARPANVAPAPLGRVGADEGAFLQEGVSGMPVELPVLALEQVASLRWSRSFRSLGHALVRLAETTRVPGSPAELADAWKRALDDDGLSDAVRASVQAAAKDARRVNVSVLRHGALSGRHWLVSPDGVTGLVDWSTAVESGVPGFDVLDAAMCWFDRAVRRSGLSDEAVEIAFTVAWDRSPFFAGARRAASDAAAAAGVPAPLHDSLLVAYLARRLGERLAAVDTEAAEAPGSPAPPEVELARQLLSAACR